MPGARRWLLLRAGGVVFVLWAAATVTFFALRLIPGDPAEAILGGPGSQAGPEALEQVRREYGLDRPLVVQYLAYLGRLLAGDLGQSYSLREPVASAIGEQLGATLTLAVSALVLAWALACALAAWSVRGGRVAWAVGSGLELVAAAVPHFWLATVLILFFSTTLGVLPPVSVPGPLGVVLPALTLAVPLAGFLGQVMRESLLSAMESPFVTTARARGESEVRIFWRHTLRHAAIPAVGLSGWAFGSLISGAVVVEAVFARQGLGRSLLSAVQLRDVTLVTGIVLVVALAYTLMTLLTDVADRLVDPRTRTVPR
ncbi:ABC transporter permease [Promicromonospora citrea]|uniref:ABC transporter permease n=1 Tax=Promicromonospora citrea TaxID=43677 RepID=A0A8H9GK24_9MICO|nr:ABC transporter permease [Promicromonospora citrea]NNH51606.1 ABC transporter permease [Promicromonospora citrea]GGM26223.1 ABC transporter permease [Promicromonospora citrea]